MKKLALSLPDYKLDTGVDLNLIGLKIEEKIGQELPHIWMAMRAISLSDHVGKSMQEVQDLIRAHGTDRYDLHRKGVHHEMDKEFGIELHAIAVKHEKHFVCPHYQKKGKEEISAVGAFLQDFYHGAIIDRAYPLRIDLLLFYQLDLLLPAPIKWGEKGAVFSKEKLDPKLSSCFRFKHPEKKQQALMGLLELA